MEYKTSSFMAKKLVMGIAFISLIVSFGIFFFIIMQIYTRTHIHTLSDFHFTHAHRNTYYKYNKLIFKSTINRIYTLCFNVACVTDM